MDHLPPLVAHAIDDSDVERVAPPQRHPTSVLFVCTFNSVRSVMAAAALTKRAKGKIYVESAGVFAGDPDPFVAALIKEEELPPPKDEPKSIEDLGDGFFDLVVTLSEQAQYAINLRRKQEDFETEHWAISDPTGCDGSREERIAGYRAVLREIERRIGDRFNV